MSVKNSLTKMYIRSFVKNKSEEEMLKLIETSGIDTSYDAEDFRITKVSNEFIFTQHFYKDVRLEEMCGRDYTENPSEEKIILFFHGGGYLGKLNSIYTEFMHKLCLAAKDYKVISVEYRTANEAPFPAAYEDALTAWEYLTEKGYKPENIIIMGDSAGGGLGLALAMHLRDQGVKVKAYMGLSPWVDLTCSSECHTNPEKKKKDPLFGNSDVIKVAAKMYVGENDAGDWRISPLMGSFENLPKMFVTYGDCEIFRDEIRELCEKAKEHTKVISLVYEGCQHDIQTTSCREARDAWKDIEIFIRTL